MNRVTLVGRITKDPELRTSATGVSFTSFSIAVNRQVPNQQGERVADFINCVAFNKQAENLARFVKKGGLIAVDGKLQTSSYQAQDGTVRNRTDVVCDTITFLSSPQQNNQNPYNDFQYQDNYNQVPNYQQQQYNNNQNQNRNQYNQQNQNGYNQNGYNQNRNNYNQNNNYNPNYNPSYNPNASAVQTPAPEINEYDQSVPDTYTEPKEEPVDSMNEEKVDDFKDAENQFTVSDDDFPF